MTEGMWTVTVKIYDSLLCIVTQQTGEPRDMGTNGQEGKGAGDTKDRETQDRETKDRETKDSRTGGGTKDREKQRTRRGKKQELRGINEIEYSKDI